MEVELNKSGLKNLDPMFFWKYVMAKKREKPCIVIVDDEPKKLTQWTAKYPLTTFVVEMDKAIIKPGIVTPNIVYRWRSNMSYIEWLERWQWVDYVLCDKENREYWIQAQLCGVKPIFKIEDLENVLENIRPLDSVQRIENWENARSLLT